MSRRVTLALLVLTLVLVAGCAGGGGDEAADSPPLTGTAAPATLDPAVRNDTGYAERRADTSQLNTTITASIQGDVTLRTTRKATVTAARRVYVRPSSAGPAVVALYSVPAVEPFENADLRKNPAGALSRAALVTHSQSVYADVRDVSQVGSRSVTLLGNETTLARYRATATRNGSSTTVTAAVATVRHRGDYVTVVAVTPRGVETPFARLLGAVRHAEK
ncbi:MAG: DUF6517 family protein [Haloplanus sp.]